MSKIKARKPTARKKLTASAPIITATVRPTDVARGSKNRQAAYREAVTHYVKWVKVAASRNASAVAGLPLKVMRRTGRSTGFQTRRLGYWERKALWPGMGGVARRTMQAVNTDVEEITDPDHPLVALLANPNPRDSGYDFIEQEELGLGLTGNGYAALVWGPRWPVEWWPLQPQFVEIVPDRTTFISGYWYGRGMEIARLFGTDEITHWKRPNPTGDPYYGLGDLASCVTDAVLSEEFSRLGMAMLDNGAQPGLIVTGKGLVTNDLRKQVEEELGRRWGGVLNAGKSIVLGGDITVTPIDTKSEMKFLESAANVREVVAAGFDMPVEMLTLKPGGLNQNDDSIHSWQRFGVRPRAKRYEDTLNRSIVPIFRLVLNDPTLFVCFGPAVDEDEAAAITNRVAEVGGAYKTVNEGRAEVGLPPIEGGDLIRQQATDPVQMAELAAARPAAVEQKALPASVTIYNGASDVRIPEDSRNPPDNGNAREGQGDGGTLGSGRIVRQLEDGGNARDGAVVVTDAHANGAEPDSGSSGSGLNAPEPEQRGGVADRLGAEGGPDDQPPEPDSGRAATQKQSDWFEGRAGPCEHEAPNGREQAALKDASRPDETTLDRIFRDFFDSITPRIVGALTMEQINFAREAFITECKKVSGPQLLEMFSRGYTAGSGDLDNPPSLGAFNVENKPAMEFLETYRAKLADSVVSTLEKHVQTNWEAAKAELSAQIGEGIREGEALTQIKARVREALDGISDGSAERIARTETARAYLKGRTTAWKQSGLVTHKEWLLSKDPCPLCLALWEKSRVIGLDESFADLGSSITGKDGTTYMIDYAAVDEPPAHPYCVLGSTAIAAGTVVAAMRCNYTGGVVSVRTASGRLFTVTENHKMLTRRGWRRAAALNKGDDLACCPDADGPAALVGPDVYDRPPMIEEIFETARGARGMTTVSVPTAPEYLHGDGLFAHGKIDVVATNRLLWRGLDSELTQPISQLLLARGANDTQFLASACDLDPMLLRLSLAADGIMGRGGVGPSLCRRQARVTNQLCVAHASLDDSRFAETAHDHRAADQQSECERLDSLTSVNVTTDKIVGIDREFYAGHVYDLTTASGVYSCNGIIGHNCQCSVGLAEGPG